MHAHKEVYSRLAQTKCKNWLYVQKDLNYFWWLSLMACYKNKLFKQHRYLRHKDCFLDPGFIAPDIVKKAFSSDPV